MSTLPPIEMPELQPGDEIISEVIEHPSTDADSSSLGRQYALQALYEIDISKHPVGEVLNAHTANRDRILPARQNRYIHDLVIGVCQHLQLLDDILRQFATEFPLNQVAVIDRNILRLAVYEFGIMRTIPMGGAINEAVELAKVFGAEGSSRFVNGVLGAISQSPEVLEQLNSVPAPASPADENPTDTDAGEAS